MVAVADKRLGAVGAGVVEQLGRVVRCVREGVDATGVLIEEVLDSEHFGSGEEHDELAGVKRGVAEDLGTTREQDVEAVRAHSLRDEHGTGRCVAATKTGHQIAPLLPGERLEQRTGGDEALDQTLMTDDEARQEALYQRAIDIYKAPFLQTIDMPWVVDRREKLRHMFVDALIDMGRLKKRQEKWDYALGYFVRALKETPQREDIYREVMVMYANLGRTDDAPEQYRLLEDHLNRTVGVPPSRETRELADRIRGHKK